MRIVNGGIVNSPSDLCRFMESRFATWMDRYYVEHREPEPDATTEDVEAIFDAGATHEAAVLARLRAKGRDIVEITRADPLTETRRAMDAGRDMIYQAALKSVPDDLHDAAGIGAS